MKVTIQSETGEWGVYELTEANLQRVMDLALELAGEGTA